MGYTLAQKLIKAHLLDGEMTPGSEIGLKIDQTLTQDATGTMAYLEFEAMGVPRVKTERSVAYIDHNTLQTGFENADDHRYIQSVCKNTACIFPVRATASAIRSIWSGSGFRQDPDRVGQPHPDGGRPRHAGLRCRRAGCGRGHGGGPYYITMPKMVRVNLTGRLRPSSRPRT